MFFSYALSPSCTPCDTYLRPIFLGEVTPGALIKRLLKGCEFRKQGRTRGPRGDVTRSLICLAHALIGISKSQAYINYVRLREKQP